jgi:hypothetical protein
MCGELSGRDIGIADSSSLLDATHLPLCGFQTLVDAALESSASALSSAVLMGRWELRSGEWSVSKSELKATEIDTQPLTVVYLLRWGW